MRLTSALCFVSVFLLSGAVAVAGNSFSERLLNSARLLQADGERYAALKDKRAVFSAIHVQALLSTRELAEEGEFENPEMIAEMGERFVKRFRDSMRPINHYLTQNRLWGLRLTRAQKEGLVSEMANTRAATGLPAKPWVDAFVATQGGHSLVIEDAILPIIAHIEYDLAKVVAELFLEARQLGGHQRDSFERDVMRVDRAMENAVPGVMDCLGRASLRFRFLEKTALRLDDHLAGPMVPRIRQRAVTMAGRIENREDVGAEMDEVVAQRIRRMRAANIPCLREAHGAVRWILPEQRRWKKISEPDLRLQ